MTLPRAAGPPAGARPRRPLPSAKSLKGLTPRPLARTNPGISDRLLIARFKIRMPPKTWAGPFSVRHPATDVEFLSLSAAGDGEVNSEVWIRGLPAGVWSRDISRSPDVESVECLAELGAGALYRVRAAQPPIINLYRKMATPLPFPLRLKAGSLEWEVVARAPQFAEVLLFAHEADPKMRVTWVRKGPLHAHLPRLSSEERQLLATALEQGYFCVPQRGTIARLAKSVGSTEAAVAQSLGSIEDALLASALQERSLG
jgi:hypothetical protein